MKFGIWAWIVSALIICGLIGFWIEFYRLTIDRADLNVPLLQYPPLPSVEGFKSNSRYLPIYRSVELFNPSAYTGIFTRKFNVRSNDSYTRLNYTLPLYNQTKLDWRLRLDNSPQKTLFNSVNAAPWSFPEVHPISGRRLILA